MTWQEQLIAALRAVDREQAPHGIYGISEAMKTGKFPRSLKNILFGFEIKTSIPSRLGWAKQPGSTFTLPDGVEVALDLLTHASTKVRHYGDSYLLDRVHGKKATLFPDLESIVPKLAKHDHGKRIQGLLFIAHTPTERQLVGLMATATNPEFMKRYGVRLTSDVWDDIYGRGFHTGVYLWTVG